MRIVYLLIVLACLALAGCGDSSAGDSVAGTDADRGASRNGDGGGPGNGPSNLSALVFQECNLTPEDRDPIAINGRSFPPGANNQNNRSFGNNCL